MPVSCMAVGIGGFVGSVLRYLCGVLISSPPLEGETPWLGFVYLAASCLFGVGAAFLGSSQAR